MDERERGTRHDQQHRRDATGCLPRPEERSTISVICPPIAPRQCSTRPRRRGSRSSPATPVRVARSAREHRMHGSTRLALIQEPLWNVRRVAEAGRHDAEDGRGAAPDRAGRQHRADGRAGRPAPPDPALAGRAVVGRGAGDGRAAGGQDGLAVGQRQPPPQAAAPAGLHRARRPSWPATPARAGGGPRRATSAGASRTSSPTASAAGSPTRRRWRTSATRSARSRRG